MQVINFCKDKYHILLYDSKLHIKIYVGLMLEENSLLRNRQIHGSGWKQSLTLSRSNKSLEVEVMMKYLVKVFETGTNAVGEHYDYLAVRSTFLPGEHYWHVYKNLSVIIYNEVLSMISLNVIIYQSLPDMLLS